jgi:predicted 3-demethylubiquinone-9 3-methyltransferase (glyoxalase superfamily)
LRESGPRRILSQREVPMTDLITPPAISTCLWFTDQAEEAARFYCSLFEGAEITEIHYRNGDPSLGCFTVAFTLLGQKYWGLNGGPMFALSPAVSITVNVDTQAEVDRLWTAFLANGGTESSCGWLVDRFGLSWQIIPRALPRLLKADSSGRVMQAMMSMVKLDIAALEAAFRG